MRLIFVNRESKNLGTVDMLRGRPEADVAKPANQNL